METARKDIAILLEKYKRDIASGRVKQLGEENTKKDYITPLFRALGWDVENNYVPDEVTNEDKVSRGKVDYAFRLNSVPKFFLEAKSMKAGLTIPEDAIQAINYSWHKNCTWAVLTDFRTLVIYNAEVKEKNVAASQFIYLTCDQFLDEGQFQKLWLLSNPAFKENLLDKEALAWGKKLRKTKVGDQLLQELMGYRTMLSKDILKNNSGKNLSEQDIDEAVQRIIDRLIFIRTAEDRHIEEPVLRPLAREFAEKKRGKLTAALNEVYLRFDKTYNSKLFTFNPGDMAQRHLCETLEIDNEVLQEVINGLYQSRDGLTSYDFSAIDADVLGNIYEQYLSHILHKTEKRAKLESKEAHRKEQGIYYTPTYIVDYIVRNTLGEALKHKKPEEADKIKVLDMACGSGSFLLKAFDTLDNYYRRKEKDDYAQTNLDIEHETARISRKIKILKNNIYGVDLDPKAVEIAQLNLLLKAAETKHRLPDLRENIKRGNSLIDDAQVAGDEAFEWEKEFPEIVNGGGFDIIIGNPPYVRPENMPKNERKYYLESKKYDKFFGRFDLYILFIERALKLLKKGGYFSFIMPFSFLNQNYSKILREWMLKDFKIIALLDLSNVRVFEAAQINTCVLIIQKSKPSEDSSIKIVKPVGLDSLERTNVISIKQNVFLSTPGCTIRTELDDRKIRIIDKIAKNSINLSEICYVVIGSVPHDPKTGASKDRLISDKKTGETFKPYLEGKDMSRYSIIWRGLYLNYQPTMMHRPKFPELFENEKLIVRNISTREGLLAAYDDKNFYTNDTVSLCVPWKNLQNVAIKGEKITDAMLENSMKYDLLYCLALINSKTLNFYFKHILSSNLHVYPESIRNLPIRTLASEAKPDRLIELVRNVLSKKKRFNEMGNKQTDEGHKLEIEISELDHKIDELVYDLYGLTEEERKIVEEAVK